MSRGLTLSYTIFPHSKSITLYSQCVTQEARASVLELHPRAYLKAAQGGGFIVWISDYAAGYGKTLEGAWEDALHVLKNDLLTHDRLAVN